MISFRTATCKDVPADITPNQVKECTCSAIARYLKKISGPLLDRIDIHVEVPPIDYEKLSTIAYHRVLKLARTIADLAESDAIMANHLAEAIQYRPRVGM